MEKHTPVFREPPEDRKASEKRAEQEQREEDCRRRRSRFADVLDAAGALLELLADLFR